jgi:hypothetical protein
VPLCSAKLDSKFLAEKPYDCMVLLSPSGSFDFAPITHERQTLSWRFAQDDKMLTAS